MDQQQLCINAATGEVRATNVSASLPSLMAILGTELVLRVTFEQANVPIALASGTTGKLVVKLAGKESGEVILNDTAWTVAGTGAQTSYTFALLVDSDPLRAALEGVSALAVTAQIEWQIEAEEHPRKSLPFPITVANSPSRLTDGAPALTDAAWGWIKARLVAGSNVTFEINEEAKTIRINSAGSESVTTVAWADVTDKPSTFPAAWTGVTGKPSTFPPSSHGHSWSEISSGSPDDNAALVAYLASIGIGGSGDGSLVFDYIIPVLGGTTEQNEYTTGNVPVLVFPIAGQIKKADIILVNMRPFNEGAGSTVSYNFAGSLSLGSAVDSLPTYDDLWDSVWTWTDIDPDIRRNVTIPLLEPGSGIVFTAGAKINLAVESVPGPYGTPTFLGIMLRVRGNYSPDA